MGDDKMLKLQLDTYDDDEHYGYVCINTYFYESTNELTNERNQR